MRRPAPPPTRVLAALTGAPSLVSGSLHGAEEGDPAMLIGLAAIGLAAVGLTAVILGARLLARRGRSRPEGTTPPRQRLDDDVDPIVAALVGDADADRRRRRPPPFDQDRPPRSPAT